MPDKSKRLLMISLALALFLVVTSSFQLQAASIANTKRNVVTIPIVEHSIVPLNNMTITVITPLTKNDVWIAGNYTNGSSQAQIFYEHFNGKQWTIIASPPIGISSTIVSMSAIATNNIWSVGSYQDSASHALVEHWNGVQWTIANIPLPTDISLDSSLNAVTALSTTNVWAVGKYSAATYQHDASLIEHFDGTQWQVVAGDNPPVNGPNPWFSSRSVVSMTAVTPTDIWSLALFSFGVSFAEHYDGSQWTLIPMPNINGGNQDSTLLSSISAISANDVWAVGNYAGSNESGLVAEHWNGTDWFYVSMQHLPGITQTLTSVIALQTNNVWAIGTYSNGHINQPLLMHWNGTTWNTIFLPHGLSKIIAIQRLGNTNTLMGVGIYNNTMRLFTLNGAYFSM